MLNRLPSITLYLFFLIGGIPILYLVGLTEEYSPVTTLFASISLAYVGYFCSRSYLFIVLLGLSPISILFLLNPSIYAPNGFLFIFVWLPVFLIYYKIRKSPIIDNLTLFNSVLLSIDFICLYSLTGIAPNLLETFQPWCADSIRSCSFFTEPAILGLFSSLGILLYCLLKSTNLSAFPLHPLAKPRSYRPILYSLSLALSQSATGIIILILSSTFFIFSRIHILYFKLISLRFSKLIITAFFAIACTLFMVVLSSPRIFSFFTIDILNLLSALNLSSPLTYSSEVRILGPIYSIFHTGLTLFGAIPEQIFYGDTILPVDYFSLGLNSLSTFYVFSGLIPTLAFVSLLYLLLYSKKFFFTICILLVSTGEFNKPYLPFCVFAFLLFDSLNHQLRINANNKNLSDTISPL